MKRILAASLTLMLASCAHFINHHRMKAADRKMLDARRLQQAGDWAAALTMTERMRSSVAATVESTPTPKGAGGITVDLKTLLAAWENGPLAELQIALRKKDAQRSSTAFSSLRQQCVNCHTMLGQPQARVSEIP